MKKKENIINDDSSDMNIIERGDETEKSEKSDESSINASSDDTDDTDNDNEVMESGLRVIYEAHF